MGMEHLCPFVKNIIQTANKTPCKVMTKLSNWEASGGLLQSHALTDLLIHHLSRETPRHSSSLFISLLSFLTRFLREARPPRD